MASSPAPKKRFRNRRMSTGARDLQSELLSSAKTGNMKAVKTLVEIGANINATDALGQTALHIAAYNEQEELCEYLVLNGVDTDMQSNDGMTAYQLSMAEELEDVARIIRERSRDVKALKAKGLATDVFKAELRNLWIKAQRKRGVVDEKAEAAAAVRTLTAASTVARQTGGEVEVSSGAAPAAAKKKDLGLFKTPKKGTGTGEVTRTVVVEEDDAEAAARSVKLPAVTGAAAPAEAAPSKKKVPPPPKRPSAPGGMAGSAYLQAVMAQAGQAATGSGTATSAPGASPLAKRVAAPAPAATLPVSAAPTEADDPLATGLTAEETRQLVGGATEEALAAKRAIVVEAHRMHAFALQNPAYLTKLKSAKTEAASGRSTSAFGTETVRLWLGALALEQYSKQMCEAGYDSLARLMLLEEADLKEFTAPKVLPGHRRHIMRAVKTLKSEVAASK